MHVLELWRHPVKSFQGERLDVSAIDADGLRGDRLWGVLDTVTGKVLTGRREPSLLLASARLDSDDCPRITLPDSTELVGTGPEVDRALSKWLGHDVALIAAADVPPTEAEFFTDATDDESEPATWTMPSGRFVDALPLLLLTTTSLRTGAALHPSGVWDVRRFRPNVLIEAAGDGWVEDAWCGQRVRIGEVEVAPFLPCARCTMVTRPQPGLDRDLDVFRTLAREHGAAFGVWAGVVTQGTVRTGDEIEVLPPA
jgi:uncharacterized protein YcbX